MWPVNHVASTFLALVLETFLISGHGDLEMCSSHSLAWSGGE